MKKNIIPKSDTVLYNVTTFIIKNYTFLRFFFLISCDFIITFISCITAIYIYTRIIIVPYTWGIIYAIVAIIFFIKFLFFTVFRIYNISFQYASILYIVKTSSVIFVSAIVAYFALRTVFPGYWFFLIATLEFLFDIIGSEFFRFLPFIYHEIYNRIVEVDKACLIYGCGETGKNFIPILAKNRIKVWGFIDDEPRNLGKIVNGVKVLGMLPDLEKILIKTKIDMLIVAIPSLGGNKLKDIRQICRGFNIEIKTVPSFYRIYNKSIEEVVTLIREVNYEDLIRRPVKKESFDDLNVSFSNKRVMVTGVGSIGTELINQMINFNPQEIVVLDNCELNLFNLESEISTKSFAKIKARLLDLKNKRLLQKVFSEYKPDFVFHTAAYKHVPIVEQNLCEGVLNNLLCLKNVYELSEEAEVNKFIFISSDKAVRPTNIMGATKRLGELYVQAMNARNKMTSCTVRFGNVIGSSGSLVPKVIKQIQNDNVVTVTHPEVSRFFMLISEAVLLILKASIIAKGGEVFILDMGKQIRISDMVNDIVTFYGKIPNKDIAIEYTGLRPGEKLFEELIIESTETANYKDGMYIVKPEAFDSDAFVTNYEKILNCASAGEEIQMLECIKKYVKLYTNEELIQEKVR